MNYLAIYQKLCETRRPRGIAKEKGYEVHHILPRCMGGDDSESNLVKLTYREHFIAHRLLCKAYPLHEKLSYAFLCMLRNPHGNREISSRMYMVVKTYYSDFKKANPNQHFPGKSLKSREVASKRFRTANPMTLSPEKNHTAQKVIVTYDSGEIREFNMIKELLAEVKTKVSKGQTAIRRLVLSNQLQEYGYKNIEIQKKETPGAGRQWYTNGINNVYLKPDDSIPDGFYKGFKRSFLCSVKKILDLINH